MFAIFIATLVGLLEQDKRGSNKVISVVIPTYNRSHFISKAIECCLNQTLPPTEIIVVDDGSTDNTEQIVKQYPVTYIKKENGGVSSARNVGIKHAKTKYIINIDSDDTCEPSTFAKFLQAMENRDDRLISCRLRHVYLDTGVSIETPWPINNNNIYNENFFLSFAMFPKTAWEKVGGFDEALGYIGWEDWDFWIRLAEKGYEFKLVEEHLFNYTMNSAGLSKTVDKERLKKLNDYFFNKYKGKFFGRAIF
jgi:glycosyltransferase involved in cell wall biosynthesis